MPYTVPDHEPGTVWSKHLAHEKCPDDRTDVWIMPSGSQEQQAVGNLAYDQPGMYAELQASSFLEPGPR